MPKMAGFSEEEKRQIVTTSVNFWDMASKSMDGFFQSVNEYERLSKGLLPVELEQVYARYLDRSCLVPMDIYNNLNSNRAAIRKILFRKKPYFRLFIAGQPNVRDERVYKAEQTLQSTFDESADSSHSFLREADKVNHQALYAGLSCGLTEWHIERRRKPVRGLGNAPLINKWGYPQYEFIPVAAYPRTIAADIRRVRLDPTCDNLDNRRIIGWHHLKPFHTLVALNREEGNHYAFDEEKLEKTSLDRSKYFEYIGAEQSKIFDKAMPDDFFGDKQVEVYSVRGLFRFRDPKGGFYYRDLIVEIGDRSILLAVKDNDLPFSAWEQITFASVDEECDRIYPMGVVEPSRDTFIEQFIKRNQSLDSANRNIYNTYVGDASACANLPDYLESANDQLLKVDAIGSNFTSAGAALSVLPRPQLGQDTFQHSMVLSREVQQVMRLSNYTQGKDPQDADTATGVAALVAGGAQLTEHMVDKLTDTFYGPVSLKHLALWNFMNGDKEMKMVGLDGNPVSILPGEIDLPYHCTIENSIGMTNPAMQRRMVEIMPVALTLPNVDADAFLRTTFEILEIPNADRILIPTNFTNFDIDRENVALSSGVPQPVHPMDNHLAHFKGHQAYIQQMSMQGELAIAAAGLNLEAVAAHMAEHQQYLDEMNSALGNTKEMGGNTGNLVQPDSARMNKQPAGKTGKYTPAEGRK